MTRDDKELSVVTTAGRIRKGGAWQAGVRDLPEETPVALVYDASTEAVMMATPADLEDFAYGFSLTEGLISGLSDIARLDIVEAEDGIEARMWLSPERGASVASRRRSRVGPTGCGLCGVDSLSDAVRLRGAITAELSLSPAQVGQALKAMEAGQVLGRRTRAVHAAGFWRPADGFTVVREDVGRHNALDKLAGALARQGVAPSEGIIVLTSRVSIEMVQKAVAMGAPVLIAVSAPTAFAVRAAEAAGLTLVAVARGDDFEVFSHPERVSD